MSSKVVDRKSKTSQIEGLWETFDSIPTIRRRQYHMRWDIGPPLHSQINSEEFQKKIKHAPIKDKARLLARKVFFGCFSFTFRGAILINFLHDQHITNVIYLLFIKPFGHSFNHVVHMNNMMESTYFKNTNWLSTIST